MGRPAKPANLLLFEKKTHLSKAEIDRRLKAEIKIGDHNFMCPEYIATNDVAHKKWLEVMAFLQKFPEMDDLITSTDTDTIAMYCQTWAEEYSLIGLWTKAKRPATKKKYTSLLLKTREMRLKLQRECFLTPMSKIKNVPRRGKEKEKSPLEEAGFGNV